LVGPRKNITCVTLTLDGRKVAAGSEDGTVRLWSLDLPDSPPLTLKGHVGAVTGVTFVPDGGVLLSVGLDGMMRQWDVRTGQAKGGAQIQAGPLRAIAFGGASRRVALVGDVLRLRQPDGTFLTLEGHQEGVLCVALASDGALVASGGNDCTVR